MKHEKQQPIAMQALKNVEAAFSEALFGARSRLRFVNAGARGWERLWIACGLCYHARHENADARLP